MSHTNASRPSAPTPSRVVVGIDPGLDKHGVVALFAPSCRALERRMINNTIVGMRHLTERLREWQGQSDHPLTVALEEAGNYGEPLEAYLSQQGFDVVVVSEFKVARFRQALGPDANDLIDAEAVARFVMLQPDLARTPARHTLQTDPHGTQQRQLRQLSRRHTRWTKERTAACNELHAILRRAWLADYQRFFSDIHGAAAIAVWQRCPTPVEAAQVDPQSLANTIRQASHGNITPHAAQAKARDIHQTAQLIQQALGQKDPQRFNAWAEDIPMLARHIEHLNHAIKHTERRLADILKAINSPLLSFKGMGPVTAGAIHGDTLTIKRFATADRYARYNGTAPRQDSSGRQPRCVKNQRCNRRLRQAFLQLALNALKHQPASKAYQQNLAARGILGQAARIRLARRLSNIVYAMLRDHRPYDLEFYMNQKQRAA